MSLNLGCANLPLVEYDLDTNEVRTLDVVTNSFCAGGGVTGDGTWVNLGGELGFMAVRLSSLTSWRFKGIRQLLGVVILLTVKPAPAHHIWMPTVEKRKSKGATHVLAIV